MIENRLAKSALRLLGLAGLLMRTRERGSSPPPRPPRGPGGADEDSSGAKGGEPIKPDRPGASASSPSEIPVRGWWQALKRAAAGFNEDRVMTEAAAVTFYVLLALFPALAALVSIYGLFADPSTINDNIGSLTSILPQGGIEVVTAQLKSLTGNGRTSLGFGALAGIATALWSSNQGIKSLFDALNVVYHEHEKRGYVRRTALCLLFTLGAILAAGAAMAAIVVAPLALRAFGLEGSAPALMGLLRWPLLILLLSALLALAYRFGPSRTHARWRWLTWGSGSAACLFVLASSGFSYYVSHFGSYNKTYGSLGAIVGFMTWIWISTTIALFGAEINAELEQQTDRDSTVGREKPEGLRGAFKADVKA